MKYSMIAVVGVGLLVASALADDKDAPKGAPDLKGAADLKDTKSKASYAMGLLIGRDLKKQGADLDPDLVARGLRDAAAGKPQLSEAEIRQAFVALQEEIAANRNKGQADYVKNQKAYLEANKKKEAVKTTESGLQYKVLKEGTGKSPAATDTVKVHYKGTLIDGTQFDSSYDRGQPAEFPVNRVIAGWTEGLQLMKVGSKYQFVIPADLGYGAGQAPGGAIPPNSTLVFEVELLGVQ